MEHIERDRETRKIYMRKKRKGTKGKGNNGNNRNKGNGKKDKGTGEQNGKLTGKLKQGKENRET